TVNVVSGSSMQPALNPDGPNQRDMVWIDRWSVVARRRYRRGDVVSLRSPIDPNLIIVKRILALGGDIVETLPPYPDKTVRVPDGYAWVEGDEPFRSRDSNYFGPVPLGLIESRISNIIWPLSRLGPVPPR
ncbi:LexA/Signal peptidase, partial [Ceratobasidium sp. AG-I]